MISDLIEVSRGGTARFTLINGNTNNTIIENCFISHESTERGLDMLDVTNIIVTNFGTSINMSFYDSSLCEPHEGNLVWTVIPEEMTEHSISFGVSGLNENMNWLSPTGATGQTSGIRQPHLSITSNTIGIPNATGIYNMFAHEPYSEPIKLAERIEELEKEIKEQDNKIAILLRHVSDILGKNISFYTDEIEGLNIR